MPEPYEFTTSADARAVDHADCNAEEWVAYLSSGYPEWVNGDSRGYCCHDHRLIIVETFS